MIVVIGAGLIGLAIAYELAARGAPVRVLEAGKPAGAASWAGAGMLAPYTESLAASELEALCAGALALYPGFVEDLRARGAPDPRLRLDGILEAAYDDAGEARLRERVAALAARGIAAAWLDRNGVLACEPALGPRVRGAALVAGEGQVDNRRLGRALLAACRMLGVVVEANAGEVALEADSRRALGVRTSGGFRAAQSVVNAAGAWASALSGVPAMARVPVVPVKGQMLALAAPPGFMRRVVWLPDAYLVPRADGRLLVGATVERAGFDVRVTAHGVHALLAGALGVMPSLRDLALTETWTGLRPGTPDGLPFIGASALEHYFVATGHYRNGILLAPITARIVADVIEGKPPPLAVGAFAPARSLAALPPGVTNVDAP
jgi:glycine oxidase